MITTAVLTSVAFFAAALLVIAVLKGWAKPGSALLGVFCGALIGASVLGDRLARWVGTGVERGGAFLSRLLGGLDIGGFRPASEIPSWGFKIIFAALVVALVVAPLVVTLDGSRSKKSKKAEA